MGSILFFSSVSFIFLMPHSSFLFCPRRCDRGFYHILVFQQHSISAVTEELIRFLDFFSSDYCVKMLLYFDSVVIDKCN